MRKQNNRSTCCSMSNIYLYISMKQNNCTVYRLMTNRHLYVCFCLRERGFSGRHAGIWKDDKKGRAIDIQSEAVTDRHTDRKAVRDHLSSCLMRISWLTFVLVGLFTSKYIPTEIRFPHSHKMKSKDRLWCCVGGTSTCNGIMGSHRKFLDPRRILLLGRRAFASALLLWFMLPQASTCASQGKRCTQGSILRNLLRTRSENAKLWGIYMQDSLVLPYLIEKVARMTP